MSLPDRFQRILCLLLLVLPMALSGCTPSYWRTLTQATQVNAFVATPGKIVWTGATVTDEGGGSSVRWSVMRTPPAVTLALVEGSSGLDLEYLLVEYLSPVSEDTRGTGIEGLLPIQFPYIAEILPGQSLQLSLLEILTVELVNAADPRNTASQLIDMDVDARITFGGRNKLGQRITWKTVVPIGIDVVHP